MFLNNPKIWNRLFLDERPSLGLSFFRIFAAITVGFHVIPSFFHLEDNYLSTAFKEVNFNFFTPEVIDLIQKSPDLAVTIFVAIFLVAWFFFLIGLFSQLSCIVMTAACYYFYALNCFHIGTLSWDILLVTLFLMCLTGYHGDYFSVDCLRRGEINAYQRMRPFFIQRLLQMQIASTYFYTALYKVTGTGNWLTGNPIYYLMNYPPEGVTKQFVFREYFAVHPAVCYWIGVAILMMEFALPFLLFIRRTRIAAIVIGFLFHIALVTTLHVPTIFFFLFPPQLLLFIDPHDLIVWIEKEREQNRQKGQAQVIFDGNCQFCLGSIQKLLMMDILGCLRPVNFHEVEDLKSLHPTLTREACHSRLHLKTSEGELYEGFFVFRRLCWKLPMLYIFIVIFYFPGSSILGPLVYRWVAKNRYLFHRHQKCRSNACFRA